MAIKSSGTISFEEKKQMQQHGEPEEPHKNPRNLTLARGNQFDIGHFVNEARIRDAPNVYSIPDNVLEEFYLSFISNKQNYPVLTFTVPKKLLKFDFKRKQTIQLTISLDFVRILSSSPSNILLIFHFLLLC